MIEATAETTIRVTPCPTCVLCGGEGEIIHHHLQDQMFEVPGTWNVKRCTNRQCLLLWLDPMPMREDLGKAYARYYTHVSSGRVGNPGMLQQIVKALKREYLTAGYNYKFGSTSSLMPFGERLLQMFPLWRAEADGEVRFLKAVPRGRLLDVGCGSGDWLVSMRELGWEVTGVDFDENAARVGRQKGLTVNCGALEQQKFASDSFDAVTLNHVIEHVPDPVGTLRECIRILKPGGQLVVFTPNGLSLGHQIYKEHWRGLEPPRHLHIFSRQSLHRALGLSGFSEITVLPWLASSIVYESHLLRRGWRGSFAGAHPRWLGCAIARVFISVELMLVRWQPSTSDCVAAIAVKS